MKSLTIGRDVSCDIVLNDNSDVVSRKHAILCIYTTGNMTLTDLGHNGTYVNGIRITPNTPFPISRKDVVSFAHVIQLDWRKVPNQRLKLLRFIGAAMGVLAVILGSFFYFSGNDSSRASEEIPVLPDTLEHKKDSIPTHKLKKDSLNTDTIKARNKKKEEVVKKQKADSKKKNEQDSVRNRKTKPDAKERSKPDSIKEDKHKKVKNEKFII